MVEQYYNAKGYQVSRSFGHLVRRCSKLLTGHLEAVFVERDLTFVQYVILMHLRDHLAETASEIGQNLCHDTGALTRIIDGMEKDGLLERTRSTEDRRSIRLSLTPKGQQTVEALIPEVAALYNRMLSDFTHEEADQLVTLLARLADALVQPIAGGR